MADMAHTLPDPSTPDFFQQECTPIRTVAITIPDLVLHPEMQVLRDLGIRGIRAHPPPILCPAPCDSENDDQHPYPHQNAPWSYTQPSVRSAVVSLSPAHPTRRRHKANQLNAGPICNSLTNERRGCRPTVLGMRVLVSGVFLIWCGDTNTGGQKALNEPQDDSLYLLNLGTLNFSILLALADLTVAIASILFSRPWTYFQRVPRPPPCLPLFPASGLQAT
jgi:hypothetical protein